MNWQANWRISLFSSLTFPRQMRARGGGSGSSDSFAKGKSDYSKKLERHLCEKFWTKLSPALPGSS